MWSPLTMRNSYKNQQKTPSYGHPVQPLYTPNPTKHSENSRKPKQGGGGQTGEPKVTQVRAVEVPALFSQRFRLNTTDALETTGTVADLESHYLPYFAAQVPSSLHSSAVPRSLPM